MLVLKPSNVPAISKQTVAQAGKNALEGKPQVLKVTPPAFEKVVVKNPKKIDRSSLFQTSQNNGMKNLSSRYKKIIDDASEKVLINKPSRIVDNSVNEPNPKVINDKKKQENVMKKMLTSLGQESTYSNLSKEVTPISNQAISQNLVTKDPNQDFKNGNENITKVYTVQRNDSLSTIFSKMGYDRALSNKIAIALVRNANFKVTNIKLGQKLIFTEKVENGKKKLLKFQVPSGLKMININIEEMGDYKVVEKQKKVNTKFKYKTGEIRTNITNMAAVAGIPFQVLASATKAISNKLDLNRDVRKGDKLEILYEEIFDSRGRLINAGKVHYIALQRAAYKVEAFRFSTDNTDKNVDFYDVSATAFKKSITNKPLLGVHIVTSPFGSRKHPILAGNLMHTGVDYKARSGTPVTAAGNGTVAKIGRFGGYGNYIKIKHDEVWNTAYGHLSSFAKGVTRGSSVKKGQVIGYSGNTGRSTGPHLHFEVIRYGRAINPLNAPLPSGKRLWGKDYTNFQLAVRNIRQILNEKKSELLEATAPIPQIKPTILEESKN